MYWVHCKQKQFKSTFLLCAVYPKLFSHTTRSHAKPTKQSDLQYQHHKSLVLQHSQKGLINSWQETETRYKNNQNYSNTLNPKTKQKSHEGRVSGAGQPMADGNKNNWTLNATWPEDPHTLKPILSAMCEKNFFCFVPSSASKKKHILPTLFQL